MPGRVGVKAGDGDLARLLGARRRARGVSGLLRFLTARNGDSRVRRDFTPVSSGKDRLSTNASACSSKGVLWLCNALDFRVDCGTMVQRTRAVSISLLLVARILARDPGISAGLRSPDCAAGTEGSLCRVTTTGRGFIDIAGILKPVSPTK